MGIYDRDYYRDEPRHEGQRLRQSGGIGIVTLTTASLLGIGFVMTVAVAPAALIEHLAFDVERGVLGLELWRIFSYPFISTNMLGVALDLILLIWLGQELEKIYRRVDYVVMLLLAVLAGAAAHALFTAWLAPDAPLLGAGALSLAVAVCVAGYHPRQPTWLWNAPLAWVVGGYVAWNVLIAFSPLPGSSLGQLGGALVGFLFWRLRLQPGSQLASLFRRRSPGRKSSGGEVVQIPRREPARFEEDEIERALRQRVDTILEKISREGKDALTDEEQTVLEEASRRLREREQNADRNPDD